MIFFLVINGLRWTRFDNNDDDGTDYRTRSKSINYNAAVPIFLSFFSNISVK